MWEEAGVPSENPRVKAANINMQSYNLSWYSYMYKLSDTRAIWNALQDVSLDQFLKGNYIWFRVYIYLKIIKSMTPIFKIWTKNQVRW